MDKQKEQYEAPEMEIIDIGNADIITESFPDETQPQPIE